MNRSMESETCRSWTNYEADLMKPWVTLAERGTNQARKGKMPSIPQIKQEKTWMWLSMMPTLTTNRIHQKRMPPKTYRTIYLINMRTRRLIYQTTTTWLSSFVKPLVKAFIFRITKSFRKFLAKTLMTAPSATWTKVEPLQRTTAW